MRSPIPITVLTGLFLLTAALGTFIPQDRSFVPTSPLGRFFNPHDIYHSSWFYLILALFSLSLVFCLVMMLLALPQKGGVRHYGKILLHLALLVILSGGLLSKIRGFRYSIEVEEQQTVSLAQTDLELKLDDFWIDYYQGSGRPRSYNSRVTLLEKGEPVLSKIIRVNDPLTYKGVTIYQMSYGVRESPSGFGFILKKPDGSMERVNTDLKGRFSLKDIPYNIAIAEVKSDSLVVLGVYKDDQLLMSKELGWMESVELSYQDQNYSVLFHGPVFPSYSGLMIVKDPGAKIAGIGGVALILGLVLAFFTPEKKSSTDEK